ncbi:MAG: hypothetical protein RL636_618 [Verrucomicrobiota bacterium]|jgi:hypothetical protein
MSSESAAFELDQGCCHLSELIATLEDGEVSDDHALSIYFGHVLCHFNMAWHELEEIFSPLINDVPVSWDTHSCIIPRLQEGYRLLPGLYFGGSPADSPKVNLCTAMLREVMSSGVSLVKKLNSSSSNLTQEEWRMCFSGLIEGLNMSWHVLREDEKRVRECRMLIPNFNFEMQMV